jgi:hypothetical protein
MGIIQFKSGSMSSENYNNEPFNDPYFVMTNDNLQRIFVGQVSFIETKDVNICCIQNAQVDATNDISNSYYIATIIDENEIPTATKFKGFMKTEIEEKHKHIFGKIFLTKRKSKKHPRCMKWVFKQMKYENITLPNIEDF